MPQRPIPILMYHSIADMPKGTVMRSLHVPEKRFAFQMKLLKILGYRGVSMSELQPYLVGEKSGKVVGITFDDGYQNNLTRALPVLEKYNFSATCYIVSQNIGGINHWDIDKGIPKMPMMSKSGIQQWIDSGMEIGSHSQSHVFLSKLDTGIVETEIQQSKADLENNFNTVVEHFCYPYGDYNNAIISATQKAGYQTATTVDRGVANISDNLLTLPRIPITHHTLPHLFLLKILGKYEDRRR